MIKYFSTCSLFFLIFLGNLATTNSSGEPPSTDTYTLIGSYEGVKAYWMTDLDSYVKTYKIIYKFENATSHCVLIKYRTTFRCGSETGREDAGAKFVPRHQVREGETNGLYSLNNPCPAGVRPTDIRMQAEVIIKPSTGQKK